MEVCQLMEHQGAAFAVKKDVAHRIRVLFPVVRMLSQSFGFLSQIAGQQAMYPQHPAALLWLQPVDTVVNRLVPERITPWCHGRNRVHAKKFWIQLGPIQRGFTQRFPLCSGIWLFFRNLYVSYSTTKRPLRSSSKR